MSVPAEVDVILLSWNRAQMTLESIASILAQENVSAAIWVVDQGSKEEDIAMLREGVKDIPNLTLKELKENVGVPAGRNIGTRMGSAKYTVSIDNDAVFEDNGALRRIIDTFEQDGEIGIVGFRIKNFYTGLDDEGSWCYPKPLKSRREEPFWTTRFVGCGHAIRRDAFDKAGGYDDDLFFYWEELDLSYRIINLGFKILYAPAIVIRHKVSPEARVEWGGKRFYFLVRNAIYINLKYSQSKAKSVTLMAGYALKGLYNRLPAKAISGLVDGVKMYSSNQADLNDSILCLDERAKSYIQEHETDHRGSLWQRLKNEVFAKL